MPRNIILIHADQLRQDGLGCYGNPAARTPNLDALAARGGRFNHHYASNPVCMPSRCSLLTGRHLPAHGVIDNGIPLDTRVPTLPGVLARQGYQTYSAGKLHLTPTQAPADSGFGESVEAWKSGRFDDWRGPYYGFEDLDLTIGHGPGAAQAGRGHYAKWLADNFPYAAKPNPKQAAPEPKFPDCFRWQIPVAAHHSSYVADCVIDFLSRRDQSRPFFIFAGFADPHHPFCPPTEYAARFDDTVFPEPHARTGEHDARPSHYHRLQPGDMFPTDGGARPAPMGEHWRQILQNTYGMISLIDYSVGRILRALEQSGLADDTIVCFTSDHGDLMGDHGLLLKGQLPFASLMRVPLIIAGPDVPAGVTEAACGNVDVMPTLMELAGAKCPQSVQGVSQVPVLRGERRSVQDTAFSCGWSKASPDYRHMSLHSADWRITYWPGLQDGELYDVRSDPWEFQNLFHRPEHAKVRDRLMADLLKRYASAGPLEPHVMCDW